jgi:hypothetical protein
MNSTARTVSLFSTLLSNLSNACCEEPLRAECPYDIHAAAGLERKVWGWIESSLNATEVDIASAVVEPMRFLKRAPLEVGARHKYRAIRHVIESMRDGVA